MKLSKAMFGAGCFWGVQFYFDQVPGVVRSTAGYSGGHTTDPNWHNTHESDTGHAEVVLLEFDATKVTYQTLVRHFFRLHDPTLLNSDGINHGTNYRSVLFYFDDAQRRVAEKVRTEVQINLNRPIVTQFAPAGTFYEAEPLHQKYTERTGRGMCHVPYEPLSAP